MVHTFMFAYVFTYIHMYVLCTNVEAFVYAYECVCTYEYVHI